MVKKSPNPKEVVELLAKLKSTTPDYPADLMTARRAAFIKQAVALKLDGKGQGGEGGQQGGGGAGTASGGASTAHGFLWQALFGICVAAVIFLAAYLYHNYLGDLPGENEVSALAEGPAQSSEFTLTPISTVPTPSASLTPILVTPAPSILTTSTTTGLDDYSLEGAPAVVGTPEGTKDNPGLHLGETPGTPAAPGQGNPGNENQPDKPDKPEKPVKPEKPPKPEK